MSDLVGPDFNAHILRLELIKIAMRLFEVRFDFSEIHYDSCVICLFVCLFVCLSVCLFVRSFVCLFVCSVENTEATDES